MKIIILGGDGFCGWPTALYLSRKGHKIIIIDNLSRRKIEIELECCSLTPIKKISERLGVWKNVSGESIEFYDISLDKEYSEYLKILNKHRPDAIVHFAEQRAAPYSMRGSHGRRYTVSNNICATNNVLAALVEADLDAHIVHLGTMGLYGYGDIGVELPEGYLKVHIRDRNGNLCEREIMFPHSPGSIYHMTKAQDALMFDFYNKNDGIRVTDLHQGVVWGTQTEETELDDGLINRFDYNGEYGTVLNRFIVQSVVDHPITVYGTGGQTRAFIHIRDTIKCIEIALENSPERGERVRVYNQMTETHVVRKLAEIVSSMTGAKIKYVSNPRNEPKENTLKVNNDGFISLGLEPITLNNNLIKEIENVAHKYKDNCDLSKIISNTYWNRDILSKSFVALD